MQKVIIQFPTEQLGKDDDGKMLCPMKVYTRLNLSAFLVRSLPLKHFCDLNSIDENRASQLVNTRSIHEALAEMHESISTHKEHKRMQSQMMHNAKANVLPINFEAGDYLKIRTHAKRSHKLHAL